MSRVQEKTIRNLYRHFRHAVLHSEEAVPLSDFESIWRIADTPLHRFMPFYQPEAFCYAAARLPKELNTVKRIFFVPDGRNATSREGDTLTVNISSPDDVDELVPLLFAFQKQWNLGEHATAMDLQLQTAQKTFADGVTAWFDDWQKTSSDLKLTERRIALVFGLTEELRQANAGTVQVFSSGVLTVELPNGDMLIAPDRSGIGDGVFAASFLSRYKNISAVYLCAECESFFAHGGDWMIPERIGHNNTRRSWQFHNLFDASDLLRLDTEHAVAAEQHLLTVRSPLLTSESAIKECFGNEFSGFESHAGKLLCALDEYAESDEDERDLFFSEIFRLGILHIVHSPDEKIMSAAQSLAFTAVLESFECLREAQNG